VEGTKLEATNKLFYVRGTSPSIILLILIMSQSQVIIIGSMVLNATSNWSLRCGDGEAQFYGTVTATNFIDQHKD
jgi:hypothetical protein